MSARFGLLAPMTHELAPVLSRLGLDPRPDDPGALHRAHVEGIEIVVTMTGIGMAAAADATRRVVDDAAVDHVVVVGIAGGIGPTLPIGALVVPEAVLHGEAGTRHVPAPLGEHEPAGLIRSSDDLLTDETAIAALVAEGVVALDMETAAVAAACEARGVPWSVFRAISDRPADGLVDNAVWEMTRPDGSADPDALRRYLAADAQAAARLSRLARDMEVATAVAATAALRACGLPFVR